MQPLCIALIAYGNLTNRQQVEPRAIGKRFHGKVWKILMTFLWSTRVQTMENCCWFVFCFFCNNTNIVTPVSIKVSRKITCTRKRITNCPTIISFPCSDSYRPYGSWPIGVWKIIQLWQKHMLKAKMKFRIKWFQPVLILNFLLYLRPNIILYDHKQLGLGNKWKWESSNIKTILTRISCCALQSTHISNGTWIEVDVIHYSGKSVHFKFHLSKVCLHWSFIFSLDFIIWGDVERWLTKTICQCN